VGERGRGICIVGMARSGTSLTARFTGLPGAAQGLSETLIVDDARHNPTGYWEQRPFVDVDDALLAGLRARAAALLDQHFGGEPLWVFKDPRAARPLRSSGSAGSRAARCGRGSPAGWGR